MAKNRARQAAKSPAKVSAVRSPMDSTLAALTRDSPDLRFPGEQTPRWLDLRPGTRVTGRPALSLSWRDIQLRLPPF